MQKKIVLLMILLVTTVFISGCVDDRKGNDVNQTPKSDYIPQSGLPAGFTFMGIHETSVDIGGISENATEGVYRNGMGEDLYIQAYKNDNPQALVARYKLRYKDANYDPFEEVSFNSHNATQIKEYITVNGQQTPHYSLIWASDKYMMIVGLSTDPQSVMALATATGH